MGCRVRAPAGPGELNPTPPPPDNSSLGRSPGSRSSVPLQTVNLHLPRLNLSFGNIQSQFSASSWVVHLCLPSSFPDAGSQLLLSLWTQTSRHQAPGPTLILPCAQWMSSDPLARFRCLDPGSGIPRGTKLSSMTWPRRRTLRTPLPLTQQLRVQHQHRENTEA